MIYDVLVVGAGQAGLATAYSLQQQGLNFRILEAGERASGSWPSYYDSLRLFSPARYSSLPGLVFPGDLKRYPYRDEVVEYLEHYAKFFDFPITFNTRVTTIERHGMIFSIQSGQQRWQARTVVVASGSFNQPNIPDFLGLHQFKGQVLHSSDYHRPTDIKGQRVVVVGAGNSAVQIAYELSQNHDVILTSRQPPYFIQQRPFGKDIHFWLRLSGLDTSSFGTRFLSSRATQVLDTGRYRQALADGHITWKPMFYHLDEHSVCWSDEERSIDTLLLATGFIHQPSYLEGLEGYDAPTAFQQKNGISLYIPGLYFVGTSWQRAHASATLRGVGADARYVVKHLQHYLESSGSLGKLELGCC
ncbi:MAG: NAD(P)/FAD-dependent oxidoreductase [Acinetobacter sp.]